MKLSDRTPTNIHHIRRAVVQSIADKGYLAMATQFAAEPEAREQIIARIGGEICGKLGREKALQFCEYTALAIGPEPELWD